MTDRPPTNEVVQLHNQEGVDSLADAGRAFHEGKQTEEQFRAKLFDLGVSDRDADLEFFYNHPSNKDWAEW